MKKVHFFAFNYLLIGFIIFRLISKFEETGSVLDDREGKSGRKLTVTTEENIEKAKQLFENEPETSIRRGAQQLGISKSSLANIVRHELNLYPYKIQLYHQMVDHDVSRRFDFANVIIEMMESGQLDPRQIWFSDEAHFHLRGYVNKQNWRHWGSENPHLAVPSPLHPQRVTVWCALSSTNIIGPIFIEGNVTAEKYKQLLNDQFLPKIKSLHRIRQFWFQQDGARPHRTADVFECLINAFRHRIIGLDVQKYGGEGLEWPPFSPDLNPCDYFLWGFLKDRVYRTSPQTIDDLKQAIKTEIMGVRTEVLQSVTDGFKKRIYHLVASEGGHFENLIH